MPEAPQGLSGVAGQPTVMPVPVLSPMERPHLSYGFILTPRRSVITKYIEGRPKDTALNAVLLASCATATATATAASTITTDCDYDDVDDEACLKRVPHLITTVWMALTIWQLLRLATASHSGL